MKVGSLFSGYGGLDLAVTEVLDAEVTWHCEIEPAARKVLSCHWPAVPNHGDVAAVDWAQVEPVDVIAGGFPCQTVSKAGRRAGLEPDQSGFLFARPSNWAAMATAVRQLRPQLVVIENVRGLLGAGAGAVDGQRVGSAFGIVLSDLADLGFDAEWTCLPASAVGAPHGRDRVFVVAAHPGRGGFQRWADRRGVASKEGSRVSQGLQRQRRGYDARDDRAAVAGRARWGDYVDAVEQWERLFRGPAPAPSLGGHGNERRLNPALSEWMMGLPAGWVTDVPRLGRDTAKARTAMLRLLGNGVLPAQAALAIRALLDRLSANSATAAA